MFHKLDMYIGLRATVLLGMRRGAANSLKFVGFLRFMFARSVFGRFVYYLFGADTVCS